MKMKKQGGGRNEYTNFELFHLAAAAGSGSTASRQHKRRGRKKYGLEAAAGRAAVTRCVFHNHGRCWRRWWQQQHRSCQIYGLGTHLNQFSSSNVWSLNIAPGPSQFFFSSSLHSQMWCDCGRGRLASKVCSRKQFPPEEERELAGSHENQLYIYYCNLPMWWWYLLHSDKRYIQRYLFRLDML